MREFQLATEKVSIPLLLETAMGCHVIKSITDI